MRIGNISNNVNFGRVYAVAGTKEQLAELRQIVQKSAGSGAFFNATDLYKNRQGDGLCTEAANNGKEVAFVVAGKEDYDKVYFMRSGWTSLNGISHHIDRFIDLENVKKQARAIQKMMKKEH